MNRTSKMRSAAVIAAAVGASLTLPAQQAEAAAVTRWVDNGSPAPAGPRQCGRRAPYGSIQAAVDASAPGDVIRVCPGAYPENVSVTTDDLTIWSAKGAGVTSVNAPVGAPGIYVRAREVTVKGLTVAMTDFGDAGIGVNVANEGSTLLRFTNNRIIGGRIGINLGCASWGSRVVYNTLYRQTESAINVDTCEIDPFPGSHKNDIGFNAACAPTASGSIALGGSSDLNNIHDNKVRSISVFGTANHVHDNTTKFPIVDNGSQTNLHNNTVKPGLCP